MVRSPSAPHRTMHRPTPPAHPAKPAHARGAHRGGSPSRRRAARRIALTAVVAAVAATATVLGVTLRPGAGHAAVGSTRSTTTTTALPASGVPSTTSRSAPVSTVPSGTGTAPSGSGGSSPKSDRLPSSTPPSSTAPTSTSLDPVLSSTAPCTPAAVPGGVYAVGDSVMIDAQGPLQGCVSNIQVNAAVSRQWSDGETILRQVMVGASPPSVVVVGLGTNGPITDSDFDAMMSILQGASRVVFVTVHVDQSWQDQVNGVLARGVARYPKAVLADWASLAAQHPEWFYSDGTHLPIGGPGAQALAALVASKV